MGRDNVAMITLQKYNSSLVVEEFLVFRPQYLTRYKSVNPALRTAQPC